MTITNEQIKSVYFDLKERKLHPTGEFDKAGRFYLEHNLTNVRSPSRAYPYSQMVAGRTLKYVKALVTHYNIQSEEELRKFFNKA
jgi:hypothetical protein